jgi:hypothetical protein
VSDLFERKRFSPTTDDWCKVDDGEVFFMNVRALPKHAFLKELIRLDNS